MKTTSTCPQCGNPLPLRQPGKPGRPRVWCKPTCASAARSRYATIGRTVEQVLTEEVRSVARPDDGTRGVEFAAGYRLGDFPGEWGEPEGRPYSDQREQWVADKVKSRIDVHARHFGRLARHDGRLAVILLRAALEQRKDAPTISGDDALAALRRRYLDPSVGG